MRAEVENVTVLFAQFGRMGLLPDTNLNPFTLHDFDSPESLTKACLPGLSTTLNECSPQCPSAHVQISTRRSLTTPAMKTRTPPTHPPTSRSALSRHPSPPSNPHLHPQTPSRLPRCQSTTKQSSVPLTSHMSRVSPWTSLPIALSPGRLTPRPNSGTSTP